MFDLILLFSSAFVAATIFPAQSELVLIGLNLLGEHSKVSLFFVATIGNVLGSLLNWCLGYFAANFEEKRNHALKKDKLRKAKDIYQKWGVWSLLFAWLPIIGDPLTLVSGFCRVNIWLFLLLVTVGKAGRYLVILFW